MLNPVLTGAAGIIAVTLFGLHRAISNIRDGAITFGIASLTIIGWFLLDLAFASAGVFRASANRIPTIQYGILIPILIGAVTIWRSARAAQIIEAVPQHWLVAVQLYRALGIIFLILYASANLPGFFAWPAGLGDVLVGVLAPVVAIAYLRAPDKNIDLVSWWNLFGLADLAAAVTAGFLTSPSPFQLFASDRPNELISEFPLVLVPIFLVPLSVLLHLASLAKLRRTAIASRSGREIAHASA